MAEANEDWSSKSDDEVAAWLVASPQQIIDELKALSRARARIVDLRKGLDAVEGEAEAVDDYPPEMVVESMATLAAQAIERDDAAGGAPDA